MPKLRWNTLMVAFVAVATYAAGATAQVTTSSVGGTIRSSNGQPVAGARVTAIHLPSGSIYTATSRADGGYVIPAARVGGPYEITAKALSFAPSVRTGVSLDLGTRTDLDFTMTVVAVKLNTVEVTADAGTFSSTRTGAATKISSEAIAAFPTIGRTITDFTRLTPQASGSSFAGMDNRYNNFTIDGSYFNNSFGLAGQPGGRTNVAPIPIEALDQIQVAIAPYDVRQGNFVGAGINAVTRSGTNKFQGSAYNIRRDQSLVGNRIDGVPFNPGTFKYNLNGAWISGPIFRNRLFFFASYEDDKSTAPGTTFLPNSGTQPIAGNVTRVLDSDLSALQSFLSTKFNYQTGPYTGYSNLTPSTRQLYKIDWNVDDKNKVSLRYNQLASSADQLISNSNSQGFGNRRTNNTSMSFQNSGYSILENIKSIGGEWNSRLADNVANNLVVGYTTNDESRGYKSGIYPTVDILSGNSTYMSFGMDPFTPFNQLRYKTFQVQNNLSFYTDKHDFTLGVTYEKYHSDNVFDGGGNSVYVYSSLADFYTDANDFLANPNRTVSPVTLQRFQLQYVNIPGLTQPLQALDVKYYGAYAQDEWRVTNNLKMTAGIRVDVANFANTAYDNPLAAGLTFRDANFNPVQYNTAKLPSSTPLWSPRLGFNWDVNGDKITQVRGGTGVFTGKPAYVWISNQVGNNGILTGTLDVSNTKAFPFNPNPNAYAPAATGLPAPSYTLNFTQSDFKFPQLWRSNLAVDRKLPWGYVGTVELIYSRDINGMAYTNANLSAPVGNFTGADQRPRWVSANNGNRLNANINGAYVLQNENTGYSYDYAVSIEKAFENGFFAKAAYNYGQSRNTVDPGSIAQGNWTNNAQNGNPNAPGLGYSGFSPGHRFFVAISYKNDYFRFGTTTVSLFGEGFTQGNYSYTFSGDANGDGAFGNDLIYVPRNASEMNFQQFTSSGHTFTTAEQSTAWDAFINQDPYLSMHRGEYAQRNAAFQTMLFRADLSISQNIFTNIGGTKNALEVRLDILNFGNLINNRWGVSENPVTTSPLTSPSLDANGALAYRLRNFGTSLINTTWQKAAGTSDAYRMQLGFRYRFN